MACISHYLSKFHENMFNEIIKCHKLNVSLQKQDDIDRSCDSNTTLQEFENSIFILHRLNINTLANDT